MKTKTQLLAERAVLRSLITAAIAASADNDLSQQGPQCAHSLLHQHVAHHMAPKMQALAALALHPSVEGLGLATYAYSP